MGGVCRSLGGVSGSWIFWFNSSCSWSKSTDLHLLTPSLFSCLIFCFGQLTPTCTPNCRNCRNVSMCYLVHLWAWSMMEQLRAPSWRLTPTRYTATPRSCTTKYTPWLFSPQVSAAMALGKKTPTKNSGGAVGCIYQPEGWDGGEVCRRKSVTHDTDKSRVAHDGGRFWPAWDNVKRFTSPRAKTAQPCTVTRSPPLTLPCKQRRGSSVSTTLSATLWSHYSVN